MKKTYTKAILRLSKKEDYSDTFDLEFDLIPSKFLSKWIDRYHESCQRNDKISEPWAFYNLNNDWNDQKLINFINEKIDVCNRLSPGMFKMKLCDINDQDTLNYIHSIFELHHGQLDEWKKNPIFSGKPELRDLLSHINQAVHRTESHGSEGYMRIVYFDLPKTKTFSNEDYSLFTDKIEFGGLYTLYADVGKNLESLARDNDDHHHDFVPNLHYSVDCSVQFYDRASQRDLHKRFLDNNWEYFSNKGYSKNDPRLTTGKIKLGQLVYEDRQTILDNIKNYDHMQNFFLF
jgi:hypothetical protein